MFADIVVIGSLNMDLVVNAERAPEAGETVFGRHFHTIPGGKGANQAVAAAKAGGDVAMIGRVGSDDFGKTLTDAMCADGVKIDHLQTDCDAPTGVAMIVVDAAGENRILVVAGANGNVSKADLDAVRQVIQRAKLVVFQLEIPLETVAFGLQLANEAGAATVLNAAPAYPLTDALLARVGYLIVNEHEATLLSGLAVTDVETARRAGAKLLARGATAVLVTLGVEGVVLVSHAQTMHIPGHRVTAVDSTAAGDAFVGAFIAALSEGQSPIEAARLGNAAGALTVTKPGAQPALPTRAKIDQIANKKER